MKKIFLLLLTIPVFTFSQTKEINDKYIEEFNILVTCLKEFHPQLYTNITDSEFESYVNNINSRLKLIESKNNANYVIQELLYKIGNSHIYNTSIFQEPTNKFLLPFTVIIIDKKIYIKDCYLNKSLNGKELLKINNTESYKLVDSLKIFFPNDGISDVINKRLEPLFNILYSTYCQEKENTSIVTTDGNYNLKSATIKDSIYNEIVKINPQQYFGLNKFIEIKYDNNLKYGYFKFNGFITHYDKYNLKDSFDTFIDEAKKRNLKNVIIDLRTNNGGDPYICGYITSKLTKHSFNLFENIFVTKTSTPTYSNYISNSLQYKIRQIKIKKGINNNKIVRFEKGLKNIKPNKNNYKGNIILISGSSTQSSATMMCKFLQNQDNVKIVGTQQTGASNYFWGNTTCKVTLPNLKTTFTFGQELIELKKNSSVNEKPNGLRPDIEIKYSIEERLNNIDKEMEYILKNLIN